LTVESALLARAALPEAAVADYVELLKPRVMTLVVFTGFAGLVAAPGTLHPLLAFVAVLCIAIGSGAAGAINMWYDRDIDAIMTRTRERPIPAGRIDPAEALGFGVCLAIFSIGTMGLAVNWMAAGLLAAAIGFYVFVYTIWLKRRTAQNIVIGGAAGAFPPVIGWAAATGEVAFPSLALFALIFFWTPPHFWALSLYKVDEYARAGVPMLPVVAGEAETKRQILLYSLALLPVSLLPVLFGPAGPVFGGVALAFGAVFLTLAVRLRRTPGDRPAKQLFAFSILYLFVLFASLIYEAAGGGA
jgi:heme o synthase